MSDNRLPLLLEAAEKAIVAIGDVGVHLKNIENGNRDPEAFKYLLLRSADGNSVDKLCKEAFILLQQALLQFHDVDEPNKENK